MYETWMAHRPARHDSIAGRKRLGERRALPRERMFAPKTIGIDMRNENLTAVFSSKPAKRPVLIVEPLREMPRKREAICASPMNSAVLKVS